MQILRDNTLLYIMFQKIKKVLKVVFRCVWGSVWLAIHFCLLLAENAQRHIIGLLILLWWVLTIAVLIVRYEISEHKREKERAQYREKYVSDLVIEDEKYGRMVFELDSYINQISAVGTILPKFEIENIDIDEIIIDEYDEKKKEVIFRGMDHIYEHAEEIVDACCKMVKECYDDEDIKDADGNLICIESIKKMLYLSYMKIECNREDICMIVLQGGMKNDIADHIAEHGVTVCIDCSTWEYECYSG